MTHKFPDDKQKIAYVDFSNYKDRLLAIRYRKPQDVFQPLGFSGIIKLKKYLINKKIPKEKRYNLPMLCSGNEVLWMPGYALSNNIKVLTKPTHVIEVKDKN